MNFWRQQLTSLYVGLMRTYAYKKPCFRYDNPKAYPVRRLYLNLLSKSEDDDCSNDEDHYCFTVGDILKFNALTGFISDFNHLGNLQLLEGLDNASKEDKDYKQWFEENLPTAEAKNEGIAITVGVNTNASYNRPTGHHKNENRCNC